MSESVQGPDFSPLYRQVKELLLQRVLSGDWKPGEILPSEAKLAQQFQVSQGTVRKALEEMAAEHLVVRHQGKGTFVAGRGPEQLVHFFSMSAADHGPLGPRTTLDMDSLKGPATAKEQRELEIEEASEVVRVYRVRAIDGAPAICDEIVMVDDDFPNFAEFLAKNPKTNTYVIMEKEYGVLVVRADEWLSAIPAPEREAKALNVDVGTPLLQIARISFGLDGKPVETRTTRINSKDCFYFNSVS